MIGCFIESRGLGFRRRKVDCPILGFAHFGFWPEGEEPGDFAIWLGKVVGQPSVRGNGPYWVGTLGGQEEVEVLPKNINTPHIGLTVTSIEAAREYYAGLDIELEDEFFLDTPDRKVLFLKGNRGGLRIHIVWVKPPEPYVESPGAS